METKSGTIAQLNGKNYATWKIQLRMTLLKEGLWGIVNGSVDVPNDTAALHKYRAKKDRALAIIVLAVEPSLLYLLGDPQEPQLVWEKLQQQFQRKSWCNKLVLRRKLYNLKLKTDGDIQSHIKQMLEIFDELSIIGDPMEEEDRVVHVLASLPEPFEMLVTALEANEEVPKLEIVTERLLNEERKIKERKEKEEEKPRQYVNDALAARFERHRSPPKCYNCEKVGHIARNCNEIRTSNKRRLIHHGIKPVMQMQPNMIVRTRRRSVLRCFTNQQSRKRQRQTIGLWIQARTVTCVMMVKSLSNFVI